ncbi:MAG: hypothetical protein LC109_05615 [Bacteroidia bacterium]|nr:hypothetical protein [Bacteroidia bacterium]
MTNPQPVEQFVMNSADAFDDCLVGVQSSIPFLHCWDKYRYSEDNQLERN